MSFTAISYHIYTTPAANSAITQVNLILPSQLQKTLLSHRGGRGQAVGTLSPPRAIPELMDVPHAPWRSGRRQQAGRALCTHARPPALAAPGAAVRNGNSGNSSWRRCEARPPAAVPRSPPALPRRALLNTPPHPPAAPRWKRAPINHLQVKSSH